MKSKTYNKGFRKLIAWQKAHELTLLIYQVTSSFPKDERFGMTSQLRRASSSIEAQIAEGSRLSTVAHRKIFYERAYASAAEVDTFCELASDLNFISQENYEKLTDQINSVSYLTLKLSQSNHMEITEAPSLHSLPSIPSLPKQASRNHEQASAH